MKALGTIYHQRTYGGCAFHPFQELLLSVQRVWVAFEYLGIPDRVHAVLDVVSTTHSLEQIHLATLRALRFAQQYC